MLYISSGDGGPFGVPTTTSQDLTSRLGKILRIDVESLEVPFEVPPDNPYADDPEKEPTIWASGFRNPFRISFDVATGRLFAADVGEARREEINLVVKGGNYGWSRAEGSLCFPLSATPCDLSGTLFPIHEYSSEPGVRGAAVIGGRVYRGQQPTPLWGAYLFGDHVSGTISLIEETQQGWLARPVAKSFNPVVFGEDEEGRLYLADLRGVFRVDFLWREILPQVVAGPAPSGTLSCEILINNRHDEPLDAQIIWLAGDGTPIEFVIDGETGFDRQFQVEPHSSISLEVGAPGGVLTSGWAGIIAERPFEASIIYSLLPPAAEESRPARAWTSSATADRDFLVHFARNSETATDLALAVGNVSPNREIVIHLTARDLEEQIVSEADFPIPALNRRAFFVGEVLNLPESFEGTLQLESEAEFHALIALTQAGVLDAALNLVRQ
jgi:hypothetical protein